MISVQMDVSKTLSGLAALRASSSVAVQRGLVQAASELLRLAQDRVPQEIGELRRSGRQKRRGAGFKTETRVTFGTEYAAEVHEAPPPPEGRVTHGAEYNRKWAAEIAAGTKFSYKGHLRTRTAKRPAEAWKFLETPARENLGHLGDVFTQTVLREIHAATPPSGNSSNGP